MNQILTTDKSKKTKKSLLGIGAATKVFASVIIIFGMLLIASGIYSFIENSNEQKEQNSNPVVEMRLEGNIVILSVKHDKAIDKIYYTWGNGEQNTLQGKGRNVIEEEIPTEKGTNTLNVRIIDMFGKESVYSKEYTVESDDITKPEIELNLESGKVKITAKDETEIAHITYAWNDEDETKVEARQDLAKIIEEKVVVLKGENVLKVVAVDKAGNKAEKSQTYKGATKPTIRLERNEKNLVITVNDNEEIKKIEYTLNGQNYSTDPNNEGISLGRKELVITQELTKGINSITVKAYNTNNLVTEQSGEITIE